MSATYPMLSYVDLEPVKDRFGLELHLPCSFAAQRTP